MEGFYQKGLIMHFKDWIYNELAGKNAYFRMVSQHPGYQTMPPHVKGEFVKSAFGPSVNSSSKKSSGNIPNQKTQPSDFLNNSPYHGREWTKKPELLSGARGEGVVPSDFDEKTLDLFIQRCFGYRPLPTIQNDASRMDTQKKKMNPGDNEPVVILQNQGQKLRLQEGWHRTMSMLVWESDPNIGAPPEQIQTLQAFAKKLIDIDQYFISTYGVENLSKGKIKLEWLQRTLPIAQSLKGYLDFNQWRPVKIKGFVGRLGKPVNNVLPHQDQYNISTMPMAG